MSPILYGHKQSPFVRSAMMVMDMLNVDYEFKYVDLFSGEQNKPEFLKVTSGALGQFSYKETEVNYCQFVFPILTK